MSTEMITATHVEALDGHLINVTFSDGAIKQIDLIGELASAKGVFLTLRDPDVFAAVRVSGRGAVEWPGEVDLDPEVLYGLYEPAGGPPLTRRSLREPKASSRR
jgi:Protein of unknown function (DUF2442)